MSDTETTEAVRTFNDDDLISIADFHHVLPIHKRTPFAWTDFDLTPAVEYPAGKSVRKAWRVGDLREWYENRPQSKGWRARVARAAQANVVNHERVYGEGNVIDLLGETEWIEGLAEGTEELIVRIVRPTA